MRATALICTHTHTQVEFGQARYCKGESVAPKLAGWIKEAEGIDEEALAPLLNGETVATTLENFLGMEDEMLENGLAGMKEALEDEEQAGIAFAVKVCGEVVAMRTVVKDKDAAEAAEVAEVAAAAAAEEEGAAEALEECEAESS
jgi:molybdopterin converting factor small subunit